MRWGFGAVMAVIIFMTALSSWRIEADRRSMDEIVVHKQAAVEMLYHMQLAARDRTFALFGATHTTDPFEQDSEIQRFYEQGAVFGAARTQLMRLKLDETERDLLAQQRAQTAAIMPLHDRVIELVMAGRRDEAERLLVDHVVPAQNQMVATLTALLEHTITVTQKDASSARKAQNRASVLFLVGGVAGVLLTWGIFVLGTRRTNSLISRLADTSELLRESSQDLQFQKLALDEHNIVSISDVHGNIITVNDKFCEVSQYSREELLGQNHRLLKSGQHSSAFYEDMWTTISAGKVWHGEICNRRKDGAFYWVDSTILPFIGEDGLPSRYVSVRTDITQVKQAQLVLERSRDELEQLVQARSGELAEREELLRSITKAAQDAVILIDHSGLVTYWNPAAERMFGYTEAEMVGQNLHDLIVPGRYLHRHHAGFTRFVESGEGSLIGRTTALQAKRRGGEEFPVEIALSAVKLRGQWSAVGIVRDATERMQKEERLKQLATTDTLTGISNRRHFDEVLANEINRAARYSTPLSLILFDIDHFKRINDTCGHHAGDRVLIQFALIVGGAIRAIDLFARWGGEEFAILMPNCDLNAGRLLAEKLRMLLEKQHFADVGQVSCSFGVVEYSAGDDVGGLMKRVDRCLYHAKASGRNRVETTAAPALDAG
jgi:diguanylate cyclase (GGDEF)-like protein/PAS domain S-box-containing protein